MMNFYQLNSVMDGEEPYELQPLKTKDSMRHSTDPNAEDELMKHHATMQDMEVGSNMQSIGHSGELQQIGQITMARRPDYEIDGQGNITQV